MIKDQKLLPDFLIVGTMKSGTTTLGYHLMNHEDICFPKEEIHFFDDDKKFIKGIDWYSDIFKKIYENEEIIGEKTPTYSYQENVPKRIYELIPEVKLIWIFRNPVDRAYSNYLHAYKQGSDRLSFKKAIEKEEKRIRKNIFYGYLERSKYHLQVKKYLEYFSENQMHFVLFKDLIYEPYKELKKICPFLSVSKEKIIIEKMEKNKTVIPRWPSTLFLTKKFVSSNNILFRGMKKINSLGVKPGYDKIDENLREQLIDYFKEHNDELEKMIKKDLSRWNQI